ncbi:hypothetical protein 0305phi8-36p046 [Bacillus phage 0305phi8-36]|uniref:hypothetical protein n=1 Tax=Bacillus phage 0305phi8-36 TaxID=458639 RepID=UPI00015A1F8A|nr:hypothetical protein ST0305phi8-36p046 [Bacillus phage 0305phi8-36]ABS83607.1 hypothetical protein 0305phi8-36p046 [Bacillus phage 0305phi8-36]
MANVAAVRSNADLQTSELLGFLEFHTISDLRIHKDDLGQIFARNSLDPKFMPQEIKAHDAYRRATAKATSTVTIDFGGKPSEARLMVREVKSDGNMVIRHLVRELVDKKNEQLGYATVGKFILQKKTGTMDISWDSSFLTEYPYDVLLSDTQALYNEWMQFHTKDTVNNLVRRVVNDMNHVSIMPNGRATFIPRNQRNTLENLRGVIDDLEDYHTGTSKSIMEVIPMIDTSDQRDMVQRQVESQMSEEANQLLADFADLLGKGTASVKTVQRYAKRVVDLQDRASEYEDILDKKLVVLSNQLADAMKLMKNTESSLES